MSRPFFDACDGIFLNYVWNPADLLESMVLAGSRKFDVYVGVDVYGRNCYQDGGFNVDKVESNTAGSLRKDGLFKKKSYLKNHCG